MIDSQGYEYACKGMVSCDYHSSATRVIYLTCTQKCQLHFHGYTERYDSKATFSSPSVQGLIMAVGNVGETLAGYTDSDIFLSRNGGFTWQEVHKDAHLWEFGDSESVLVIANDKEPTDFILFSTDERLHWRELRV